MTCTWLATPTKRTRSQFDTIALATKNEPPTKRTKRSVSLEASRFTSEGPVGHEEGYIDVPYAGLRDENKGRKWSRGHEFTALNFTCDRKGYPHCAFGRRYLDSQGRSASGSAVSIALATNRAHIRNEAIRRRQSVNYDGIYTEGSNQPSSFNLRRQTASPHPSTKMTQTYPPFYNETYTQYVPTMGVPMTAPSYSTSSVTDSQWHTEVQSCTMSSSEYAGHFASPTSASSSNMMTQWPLDLTTNDFESWDGVPQNSPSTSSYYSFSPQVPPSLSRGSSSCSSSFPDPAYLPESYQVQPDACGSNFQQIPAYDPYTGFSDGYNNFHCSTDQNNSQLSGSLGMLSPEVATFSWSQMASLDELHQYLSLYEKDPAEAQRFVQTLQQPASQNALGAFSETHSLPPLPSVQPAPMLHAPRPHRPYIPRWQCDPTIDLDQYITPKNPNNTPCQSDSAHHRRLDIVMEEEEVDDLTEEDGEYEDDHGDCFSESGDMAEDSDYCGWLGSASGKGCGTLDSSSLLFQPVSDSVKLAACSA